MSTLAEPAGPTFPIPVAATRLGFWAAILLAVSAAAAFALGMTTPPRSGPFCAGPCILYPYTDVVQFVPRDYLWMLPGTLLLPLFLVLAGCIHASVDVSRRVLSLIGLCLASIAAGIITLDYFTQFQVVAPSLLKGETGGLALFTQYNPHGFFIVLEDLGYLTLCAAFFFLGAAFGSANRLERAIRWTFLSAGLLDLTSFIVISWYFGFNLEYRFEVTVITIVWTAFAALGALLSIYFRRVSRAR